MHSNSVVRASARCRLREEMKPGTSAVREAKGEKAVAKSAAAFPESATGTKARSHAADADAVRRKIICTATVNLVVEHFDPVPAQVKALVNRLDAYVARSQITGSPGAPCHGQWTLRVPAEGYEAFLAAARELGEVQDVTSDSQDVTEEYYDVEARIRNKKQEETRLLDLLSKATGKLEEVLSVERELSRVRGEIESMEGRLRVLGDLTTMSTVILNVSEIKDYVPEQAVTYATRVRRRGTAPWLLWSSPRRPYRFSSSPWCHGSASSWCLRWRSFSRCGSAGQGFTAELLTAERASLGRDDVHEIVP